MDGSCYQNFSRTLVSQRHPLWGDAQVEVEAKREYEAAATDWFVQTLRTCVAIRAFTGCRAVATAAAPLTSDPGATTPRSSSRSSRHPVPSTLLYTSQKPGPLPSTRL